MSQKVSISVEDLNYSFGKGSLQKQILFNISTQINYGEIVILTGPSGSGKTTLLTIVSALRSINKGSVRVLGIELNGASRRMLTNIRKNIGFIFQQHNLLSALSALQNVKLGLQVGGKYCPAEIHTRAKDYLDMVGLKDCMDYYPAQLSGGQRQRVAIARAMASEPAILMADEPTASLDKQSGRDVVEHMKNLAKLNGTTILLVTHDNRILDIADRIVYLDDGKIADFNQSLIDSNQHLMRVCGDTSSQKPAEHSQINEPFQQAMANQFILSQKLLDLKQLTNKIAFAGLVEQAIKDFIVSVQLYFRGLEFTYFDLLDNRWRAHSLSTNSIGGGFRAYTVSTQMTDQLDNARLSRSVICSEDSQRFNIMLCTLFHSTDNANGVLLCKQTNHKVSEKQTVNAKVDIHSSLNFTKEEFELLCNSVSGLLKAYSRW